MSASKLNREEPLNLDAASSQELHREIVLKQADDDPAASHVIPDVRRHCTRTPTPSRELLNQPFNSGDIIG